jgi:microcystin-dependent protein
MSTTPYAMPTTNNFKPSFMRSIFYTTAFLFCLACTAPTFAQQSIGIGTITPDSHAALDIHSDSKGVLFPRLTAAQQTTLAGSLGTGEKGMLITDAATGHLVVWTGSAWTIPAAGTTITAKAPLSIDTNHIRINPGTNIGDLLSWDGNNWVNKQPAIQHFSITVDNHQPFVVVNYIIGLFGIFPSQNDATEPFLGEIYMMGCNFAPTGFALCDGQLFPISQYEALFNLLGTTYGGDGQTTFALPNLQSRVPMHQGSNGTSNYIIGQTGGSETMTFSH